MYYKFGLETVKTEKSEAGELIKNKHGKVVKI